MPEVVIPFKGIFRDVMLHGIKVCTSRTKALGQVGDTFTWFGNVFQLTTVENHKLDYVAKRLYKQEGCETPSEFIGIWEELHPIKGFIPTQTVSVHFFKLLGELSHTDEAFKSVAAPEEFR